jgi:GT2 family glycosyltransferase
MESNPDTGICGPKLLCFDDKSKFEYAGASGGYLDKYGYPFCRGRLFEKLEEDKGQYDDIAECMWVSGAALMIKKALFDKLGGFDEDFFAHQEEIDLCWRAKRIGQNVKIIPDSYVFHVGGGTLPKSNPFKTFLNFRNNLFLIQKNTPNPERIKILFVRFFLDFIAATRMLFQFNFGEFFAVYKAYLHFWLNINKNKLKRKKINPISTNNYKTVF